MQRADRAAQILAAESDGCTSAAETGTDTTTRHRRINPLHFTSRKSPTRSPALPLLAAASLTRPRASWIEWRGHAERHGDEGEGGTGRLRQRWSLRQYTRLPHSAIASLRNRRGARAWCALPAERTPQRCEEALLSTHAAGLGALGYQRSTCVYSGCTCRPLPSMGGPRPLALL